MTKCTLPPSGWRCSRAHAHSGPCAATPDITPSQVHPSHDVRDDGYLISDPVCVTCGKSAFDDPCAIVVECLGPTKPLPLTPSDRWWAERWLKSATPAERAAMKELLS
jgi:hypothetical protein